MGKKANLGHYITLVILAVIWGSSFILMKRGLKSPDGTAIFTPNQMAALRMTIACVALLPISLPALQKIPMRDMKWLAIVGFVGSGIPAFLFANAARYLDSSISGMLNSLTPLFTLLVGLFIFKKPADPRKVAGILIGLIGAASLISLKGISDSENLLYSLLVAVATLSYGLSVNTVQYKMKHLGSLQITSVSLLFVGIPYGIYAYFIGAYDVPFNHPQGWEGLGYIVTLSLMGTAVANLLYFKLTQQTNALFASSVTYLMPIVAVLWGLADDEVLGWPHVFCSVVILSGVWLVTRPAKA